MALESLLNKIASEMEGLKGIALAGMDGLVVAEIQAEIQDGSDVDLTSMVAEHTPILRQAIRALNSRDAGRAEEICFYTDRDTLLFRMIANDYFILMVLGSEGNPGKGRYLLRREGDAVASAL